MMAMCVSLLALVVSITLLAGQPSRGDSPSLLANGSAWWHSLRCRYSWRDQIEHHTYRRIECPCGWRRSWSWRDTA